MATLNNPVNKQNLVDRFSDYVVASGNSGIVWGTNALPFPEFPPVYFGGPVSGKAIGINGSSITNTRITASELYNIFLAETRAYTRLRLLRARLNVLGAGGNNGSRPTPGIVYDATAKANMSTAYLQAIASVTNPGIISGQQIADEDIEGYFNNLRSSYISTQGNTVTIQIDVCHASCHSSCHASRNRR